MRRFTMDDVNELFSFRAALEGFTVVAAAEAATQADIARLAALVEDMARLAGQGDVHAVRRHDMMFHTEIARVSRNRHAINSFENLSTEILMLMTIPHAQVESLAASAADHRPLLDALRERSGSAATHAIQVHLRSAWTLMLKLYSGRGRPDVAQVAA